MITKNTNLIERSPVIVIMGHIDHGKSTLLDFIRKSNIVEGEAGSITQRMSAYEVVHQGKKITFIDTPGHSAFSAMRSRGACIADIAVLIISAEDGVKPQTMEAFKSIQEAKIPFIVAINKIDKPNANAEKVKQELIGNEIYLEGYGGDIPCALISAKTGEGIAELLDTMLLIAEMEELKGDTSLPGQGFILESKMEPTKGAETVAIVKDGTLKKSDFIVVDNRISSIKILEDFLGNPIEEAIFSSPVKIIGCCDVPDAGLPFSAYATKKEAEQNVADKNELFVKPITKDKVEIKDDEIEIPLIIRADVFGAIEALKKEIAKIKIERAVINIIFEGVGDISENDIKMAGYKNNSFVVGFNIKINQAIKNLAEKNNVKIASFDIIYKLTEWLEENIKILIPKIKVMEKTGLAKVVRIFSKTKDEQIIGGRVKEGKILLGSDIKILRRDFELGKGTALGLQKQKIQTKEINEGDEFGMNIKSKIDIAEGDYLEAFVMVEK